GNDVAIVSDIPGTTRDRVQQSILLDGMELLLVDTAGIRDSDDKIEAQGILRARESMEKADLVISVFEDDADYTSLEEYLPAGVHVIRVRNKIDINQPNEQFMPEGVIPVSVKDELGMDDLIHAIRSILKLDSSEENSVSARQRHVKALQSASLNIEQALEGINNNAGYEVIGEQIRQALLSFDQVLGRVTADDILGVIFSRFCIGK
ncbi:MAG: GTP-binding protein, partial [Gammaproteobacteria bacterium]